MSTVTAAADVQPFGRDVPSSASTPDALGLAASLVVDVITWYLPPKPEETQPTSPQGELMAFNLPTRTPLGARDSSPEAMQLLLRPESWSGSSVREEADDARRRSTRR